MKVRQMIGMVGLFVVAVCHAGSFEPTADMRSSRSDFTATTLLNGKILVAGGLDVSGFLASAEIYDPANGTWATTGALNSSRDGHTATLLTDGRVLVVGGVSASDASSEPLATAEIYDPAAGKWTLVGSLKISRRWHTATLLQDGRVLVLGGYNPVNGFISAAEIFEPKKGSWSFAAPMLNARRAHTATLLRDGRVLIAGGLTRKGNLAGAELYDPSNNTWITAGAMSAARKYHTATLLGDGKVLVVGGQGVNDKLQGALDVAELFEPERGTWMRTGALVTARYGHTATALQNGNVLVVGGIGAVGILGGAELYDTVDGKWTVAGTMKIPRILHAAALVPSGPVLITGGNADESSRNLSTAELFNPSR